MVFYFVDGVQFISDQPPSENNNNSGSGSVPVFFEFVHTMMRSTFILYVIQEDELRSAVLVVLANKQDIPGCLSVADVHRALGLDALKTRTFQIFKTSAVKGEGMDEAMDWSVVSFFRLSLLANFILSYRCCTFFA